MRDDDVRSSCFASLDVLCAKFGEDVPYRGGLEEGFAFRGGRIPFLTPYKGIYRSAAQRGPAALSVNTSFKSPYDDQVTDSGFLYAYRAGDINQPDNSALRAAHQLQVPLAYFRGTRPGSYHAIYPCFVTMDDPAARVVALSVGKMIGPMDERESVLPDDPIERRYSIREARVRLHQARFRGLVLPAYRDRCAICRLKEVRLLDAAHIIGDQEPAGVATISNGLSLCSIHHRAFDQDLVGISPDYEVHVASRLLEDDDGPMLDVLKGFQGADIEVPQRKTSQPNRELLAVRFERFRAA